MTPITQPDVLSTHGKAEDWALFFEHLVWPIMPRSQKLLAELEADKGETLAAKDLLPIVLQDSLLCLTLLRVAGQHKSRHLEHETTTALAALLQLGVNGFKSLVTSSAIIHEDIPGLMKVETRARMASELAQTWSHGRMDINPEEVAVAALLGGFADILLWLYAPELPMRAEAKLHSGEVARSADAQRQSCGFSFKSLTVTCAERWGISDLLVQLLRGSDSIRAQVTRICANTARHILDESPNANRALACDLLEARQLIHKHSIEWLADSLHMISATRRQEVLAIASDLQRSRQETYEIAP